MKWSIELSQHDISYQPRTTIKAQALAEFIAENTIPDSCESSADPLVWTVYVDGSSCTDGSGASIILTGPDAFILQYSLRLNFPVSNNEAEYEALIAELCMAHKAGAKRIRVFGNSQLVINQVSGKYEARDEHMAKYLAKVRELLALFEDVQLQRVPREENAQADALSKLASSSLQGLERTVLIEVLLRPSIDEDSLEPMEAYPVILGENWMKPLSEYLKDGLLPEDPKEARRIRTRAERYTLLDGVMYKCSYTQIDGRPYLRCLSPEEALYGLKEAHDGMCGTHLGARSLARKLLNYDYFWPTLLSDSEEYVRQCDSCQKFA